MFSSHFIGKLCFENNTHKFQVNAIDRWMNKTRVPIRGRPEKARPVEGAMDIFKCDRLIFPMNEGNQHWVFFSINPTSLRQQLFDSLHGNLDKEREYVSHCLYRWILHEHSRRYGKAHPKENVQWSPDCVQSNSIVFGNSSQGSTVDCALHTSVVPVLLQDKQHLDVFGKTNNEQVHAGIEMRRRMALTLSREKFMFNTRPTSDKENTVDLLSSDESKVEEIFEELDEVDSVEYKGKRRMKQATLENLVKRVKTVDSENRKNKKSMRHGSRKK